MFGPAAPSGDCKAGYNGLYSLWSNTDNKHWKPDVDRIYLHGVALDVERRSVEHADGRRFSLTELEAAVLAYLGARPGRLVTKEQLLREVWGYAPSVQSRAVDYTIRRLRQKLEPCPQQPVFLVGVYGGGVALEGVQSATGAVRANGDAPGLLPPLPVEPFIGRREELRRLQAAMDDGARLLAVLGPGGSGKTRLLREAVRALPLDCVRWLDLSGVAEEDALDARLREAGALDRAGGDTRNWLVLDGIDQVLPALRHRVSAWLQAAPSLCVLLGSRERPGIAGELPVWLPPLAHDEAVRLYEGRAAAVGALQVPGDPEIGALVDRLGGLPLAIELAAARAGVRTVAEVVEALAQPLEALREPARDGRSLRQVLALSFDLLPPTERWVLERCAVIPGRFGRTHAEVVAGAGAVEVLDRLRQRSLVSAHPGARRTFALQLGVRDLALERIAPHDRREAEAALVAWVNGRVDGSVLGLLPRAWVREELALLRVLHDRSVEEAPETATALAIWMAPLLAEQGRAQEALDRIGPTLAGTMASVVRGRMLGYLGAIDEARALLEAVVADARCGPHVRGWARIDLAELLLMSGQPAEAERLLREGQAELVAVGDRRGAAFALLRLAVAYRFRGRLDEALTLSRESRRLWESLDDPVGLAICDVDTGLLLRQIGRQTEARRMLQRAMPVFEKHGAIRRLARLRGNLGVLCADQGDRELAELHYRAALALYQQTGNRRGQALVHINLGALATWRAQYGEAEAHLLDARDIADDLGLRVVSALALGGHGIVRFFEGRQSEALPELEEAARMLDGRAYLDNAAWYMCYAGVIRALAGMPPATGLPAPACGVLLDAAHCLAAGDVAAASVGLAAISDEESRRDEVRALLAWFAEQVSPGR